jgi:peroxiredoxin
METDARNAGPKVGDRAPEFKVLDSTGEWFGLSDLIASGPCVFVFYRGLW